MFNQSYRVYIMPLVIHNLGGGHAQTHIHRRPHRNNFKKPGMHHPVAGAHWPAAGTHLV